MPAIVVVVVIVAVVVVTVAIVPIVPIVTLDILTIDLFPQQIAIYPLLPVPHGLDLDLNPVPIPGLDLRRHH